MLQTNAPLLIFIFQLIPLHFRQTISHGGIGSILCLWASDTEALAEASNTWMSPGNVNYPLLLELRQVIKCYCESDI